MPTPPPLRPDQTPEAPGKDATAPLLLHLDRVQQGLDHVAKLTEQTERLAVLGTMAASIAHEINNILTPVKAYAELALANPGETGLVVKALERAAQGVDRATRIAEMILACSRPGVTEREERGEERGTGGRAAAASPAPPPAAHAAGARAEVAEVVGRAVGAMPPDPGEMYRVEQRIEAGLAAAMDPVALEQVLVNLLLNARSAMGDGGTTTVRARRAAARKEVVATNIMIEVEDIGCGIPEDKLKSIFDMFVSYSGKDAGQAAHGKRHAASDERAAGGGVGPGVRTGLGLAICRQLIADAGGRIEAESVVGRGTRVRVILPAAGDRRGREAA